jgi:hypothetical protein
VKIPDTDRNRRWIGKIRYRMGLAGYPALRLMTLAETGTRALLGAAVGSAAHPDESHLARRLLPLLRPGMLVLLDRAFDANAFLAEVAGTGAILLARAMPVRMIDADVRRLRLGDMAAVDERVQLRYHIPAPALTLPEAGGYIRRAEQVHPL